MHAEVMEPTETEGRPRRPSRRGRWLLFAGAAVAAAVALVIGVERFAADDDPEPRLASLEVRTADLEARWAAHAGAEERADPLAEPAWELDEGLGLEVASQAFGTWGTVDLYRHPGGALAGVDLFGRFATEEDRARFRADAVVVVRAVLDLDHGEAEHLVDDELGLAALDTDHRRTVERDGVRLEAERSAASAQLRISSSG